MFGGLMLKISFTQERSCFGYLSPKYSSNNEKPLCIRVLFREKQILLWAVFNSSVPEGYIALNPIYSKMVGLEEGMEVFLAPYTDVNILDEIFIDTDSPDDQEILEQNVEILQLGLLDQLRLVVANQKAVVWISTSLPVVFTPKQTGLLVNHSRIIVKVDAFNSYHGVTNTCAGTPKESDNKFNNIGILNSGLLQPYLHTPQRLVLRALLIDSDGKKNLIHPYTVFIHEDLLNHKLKDLMIILATMDVISPELSDDDEDEIDANIFACVCVEIVPIDNVIFRSLSREVYNKNIPTVLIPKSLNQIINLENGIKVMLNVIGEKVDQPEHIEIVTYSDRDQTEMEVIEKFKNCVIENTHSGKKFLINGQLLKQNEHISDGFLRFMLTPSSLKYTLLNSESFRNCTVSARCLSDASLILPKFSPPKLEYDYKNYCRTIKSSQDLVKKIISHINFEIQREANFKSLSEIKSNILVTGENGAGKSALCHIVQKELTLWSRILHCRSLKGRKDILEVLSKTILKCQQHSPAVLICDDVDALIPPNTEGGPPQDIAYYQRLAVIVKKMLQTCSGVCVLMTAVNMQALHPTLKEFNGKPLFTAYFHIPELKQDERMELFKHLVNDKIREMFLVEDDDIIKFAMDTVGSNVREIHDYFNKKLFKAVKKKDAQSAERARLECDLRRGGERAQAFDIWGPVGGLHDVKRQLTESIFWPIMYPALFPSQSCGILLYGPPGTGKSHIGSCLARLTNMRLITVKGPELLSKYIGQSEKAVRDIFDKAAMQHPCILFFDEFDSLAPKRGHDSTGVTDRVVNQLLARLDGAEGGARGPVLAASARPDLVDPALLRAGRLAAHVYVGMPGESDRLEVIQTLSKDVSIDDEVDLQDLAQKTEGYSPADLKSLLVTAQLGRLERQLVNSENRNLDEVKVGKEDIQNALEETKPSLSSEKLLFYDTIYKRFRGENLSPEQKVISQMMQKQKVTLA